MKRVETGVISIGVKTPIIREGDDLVNIVVDSVLDATTKYYSYPYHDISYYDIDNRDVIGITESIVARSAGNYVTVDEIAVEIEKLIGYARTIYVVNPIYSRNRFSMILKGIARAAKEVVIFMPDFDEVGNPSGINPFTGVNMKDYYKTLVEAEGKKCTIYDYRYNSNCRHGNSSVIYCGLHNYNKWKEFNKIQEPILSQYDITLADIFADKCEYGLLGSNKATEEKIKLFPSKEVATYIVHRVQEEILRKTKKKVEVMIYGDGCFKDPVGGIWEFADPVVSPAYTKGLEGTPNEIKIKAFADDEFKDLSGDELEKQIKLKISSKDRNLVGNMASQGTTPRRYVDLLGSLMDLTSGSGDKGTPVVLVKNYFNNYSN